MRLFVSVNPPSEIKKEVHRWQNRWQKFFPSSAIRWVNSDNIHLTLCFLGEVKATEEKIITKKLTGINCAEKISLEISGLGFFPEAKNPRVFYLQLQNPENNLKTLAENILQTCKQIITLPDDKPFLPHLTVGRIKKKLPTLPEKEKLMEEISYFPNWVATEFYLMASTLTPHGPIYTIRQVFQFK